MSHVPAYADPYIQPDMSNYHRLLREKLRRDQLAAAHPGYKDALQGLFDQNPAVRSFLSAQHTEPLIRGVDDGIVQIGSDPCDVTNANSIAERKVFLMRIFEAAMTGEIANSDQELATQQLAEYCGSMGFDQALADDAVSEIEDAASVMATGATLKARPGG